VTTPAFHDSAAAARFDPAKLQKVNLFESARMFCDVYCLLPGQAQKVHAHAGADKLYHVLGGTARIRIGEEVRDVGAGTTAVAAADVEHGVSNASAGPLTLLVVMAPHPSFEGPA
jgi:mannose-6-phosphate isomerase-like protein (cupin superfamily)